MSSLDEDYRGAGIGFAASDGTKPKRDMKTTEEFRSFFASRLVKELESAENARKSTILKAIMVWVITIPVIAGATWGIARWMGQEYLIAILILNVLVFGFVAYMFWREMLSSRRFYNLFKGRVIDGIIRFVDERLHYIPHRYLSPSVLVKSRLFAKPIHAFEGDDYCFMQLDNGVFLEFSEVHAKTVERKEGKKQVLPVFDGLFAHVHCAEARVGDLYILPKGMTEADLYQPGRLTTYKTDVEEFDKHFTVYASSAATIRRHLTNSLIQAILEFHRQNPNRMILLASHGRELYLGMTCESHLFEPNVWQSLKDVKGLEEFFADVNALMHLLNAATDLSGSPVRTEAQPA
ncbi:MAG: DUF3137 domain-containing protein [Bacteroidia bacterium]|nr:DUF3137 domain-containing protein [Bacteroidia bacterium]MDW8057414.1 DUF3137 domain-containing protein [Bacteroidia bacterium]